MATIQERIKERRNKLGLTLLEIAEMLNVKEATVQRYESGEIKNIKHETIVALAEILNCTPQYLMGWSDQVQEHQSADSDIDINSIQYAAYQELEGESDELIEDVLDFIKFRKSQKNNE